MIAVGFLGVSAMSSAGCSDFETDPPPKPVSNWTIQDARAFGEFDLYWLGQTYQGLGLTLVDRSTDGDGVHHASFSYGELSFSGGESGSWGSPLEIDIQPHCGYSPEEFLSYPEYVDRDRTSIQIRGVNGYLNQYDGDWNYVDLWSVTSAIHIGTHKTDFDIEQAAADLLSIAQDSGAPLKPLPPPISTEC